MLNIEDTALIVIDVQGRLAQIVFEKEKLFRNLKIMIKGCKVLGVPVIWFEQSPEKLGETSSEIKEFLADNSPFKKTDFSCLSSGEFKEKLKKMGKKHFLLAGIETHVCVYQTAADLMNMNYKVHVVTDAVSSRTSENKNIGLEKIRELGGKITSAETALFELLKAGEGPKFREILNLIK